MKSKKFHIGLNRLLQFSIMFSLVVIVRMPIFENQNYRIILSLASWVSIIFLTIDYGCREKEILHESNKNLD